MLQQLPVCCKCLSPMFHQFFFHVSCKCFICILLHVASVASGCFKSKSGCCTCCNGVSTICHKCFICFRHILQMFYLDVAKVDLVLHMLQQLQTYVASVCFKCFSCFRHMLQVFYLNIAYVAVAIHICCNRMFQMFFICFQMYVVASVSCYKCFVNK